MEKRKIANENPYVSAAKAGEAASVLQRRPGFCSAVRFEPRENRDALEFSTEYEASKGPPVSDLLVIKKRGDDGKGGILFPAQVIATGETVSPGMRKPFAPAGQTGSRNGRRPFSCLIGGLYGDSVNFC